MLGRRWTGPRGGSRAAARQTLSCVTGSEVDSDQLPAELVRAGRRPRWREVAHWVVVLGGIGVLAWQMPPLVAQAGAVGADLARLRPGWLLAAIGTGVGALVAYGELHRRVLLVGRIRLRFATIQAINCAENALSTTVPAIGNAAGFVYAVSQLRRRHVPAPIATWSLVLSGLVATVTLLVLGLLGLGWTGHLPIVTAAAAAIAVTVGTGACWIAVTHGTIVRTCIRGAAVLARHVPGVCHHCRRVWIRTPDTVAVRVSHQVARLRPNRWEWAVIVGVAVVSWGLDFTSLLMTVFALNASASWASLTLGFLVVQGSVALQLFPGGAGLAEAGLLTTLVAAGSSLATATAIVVLYRLINWLGLAAIGWVIYALQIHLAPRHRHVCAPDTTTGAR